MNDINGVEIPDDAICISVMEEYQPYTHSYKITEVWETPGKIPLGPENEVYTHIPSYRHVTERAVTAEMMIDMKREKISTISTNTSGPPLVKTNPYVLNENYYNKFKYASVGGSHYVEGSPDAFIPESPWQTIKVPPVTDADEYDRDEFAEKGLAGQDCLKQCIAHLLDISPNFVPDFANNGPHEEWEDRMREWFNKYNLTAEFVYGDIDQLPIHQRMIAVYETTAGTNHAVIMEYSEWAKVYNKIYDPQNINNKDLIRFIGWISIGIDDYSKYF